MPNNRTIPNPAADELIVSVTIKVDGNVIAETYEVLSVGVQQVLNRIGRAEVAILDGDASSETFEASSAGVFVPGKKIEILAGYDQNEEPVFTGLIIKQSIKVRPNGTSVLLLECRDETIKMTLGRHSRYFYEQTDGDVLQTLLDEHSISGDIASTEYEHKELIQYDLTDWDFLMARAEANGLVTYYQEDKLHCEKPKPDASPTLDLLFGATILELDAELDARYQLQAVQAESWDYATQEKQEIAGADPSINQPGNISVGELAAAFSPDQWILQHGGALATEELQAWADAQLLRRQLAKVRARVRVAGNTQIKPNNTVKLKGLGDTFNGPAFVGGVFHQIKTGEWWTDVQIGLQPEWFTESFEISSRPTGGLVGAVQGLQIGLVTKLEEDPAGEDRIQVRLPMIDADEDGVWARVATLDAGEERGAFFRPEIGDEVIVGFLQDDPRYPIVLGMLNSSAKPAPITANDDNHEKGFVTRSGIKLLFNDDVVSVNVETPGGQQLLIDDDAGSITIKDSNNNIITLDSNGITLESGSDIAIKASGDVNIEGTNVNIKAQAQAKVEGSAGAELQSSGTTVVKGSLVQIN